MGPALSCVQDMASCEEEMQVTTTLTKAGVKKADNISATTQQTDLVKAIENNDVKAVIHLINNYSLDSWRDVSNYVTNNYRINNPMETACNLGHIEIVYIFFENGCSANLPTTSGRLIHTVLKNIQMEKISVKEGRNLINLMCLNRNCNVNIKDIHHKTPILYACEIGDVQILETLLSVSDPDILKCKDLPNGFTPLHMSVMKSDLECVNVLLKRIPEKNFINIPDNRGKTPLQLSLVSMCKNTKYMNDIAINCMMSNSVQQNEQLRTLQHLQENAIAVTELLLLHGADPNTCSNGGPRYPGFGNDNPLYTALSLVAMDETADILYGEEGKQRRNSDLTNSQQPFLSTGVKDNHLKPSSYSSVVRLLVLFGAVPKESIELWLAAFADESLVIPLIHEVFDYIENKDSTPMKLFQQCKQVIRHQLTRTHNLHKIDQLPLPTSMQAYIRFQYL